MSPTTARPETVSAEELYNVVSGAASQDPALVQRSATRLKDILETFGAFDILHEIAASRTVPLQVRQQSIIQFKNAALGHWRSRKLLSDEQRVKIRARCLTLLDEPDDMISEYNELIISKIARQDFPHNWPDLIPCLVNTINTNIDARYTNMGSGPSIHLRRSLEVLNAVLKEFAYIKMPSGIKTMGRLVEELRMVLQGHYSRIAAAFPSTLNPQSIALPRTAEDIFMAHLVLKCVVKLAVWAWHRNNDHQHLQPWVQELFQNSAVQFQALSELRIDLVIALKSSPSSPVAERSIDLLTRHVRLFGKFFRRLQQLAVNRFVALPLCSDLVLYYWSKVVQATNGPTEYIEDAHSAVFPVRFLVQAMVLFKDSLAQWAPVRKDGTSNEHALSKEFVEDAVKLLITRFIPLNPADLEGWMADPEEWVNMEEKDNEQWEFELRPCGERVLMVLAGQYPQYVTPLIANVFEQVAGQPPTDLQSVIQREALYCAIGRCAHRLKDLIPFDQWLEHDLKAQARNTNPSYPIIKRRIAWLIGKWVSEQCSSPNNRNIWEVLVHLLQDRGPGTDAVVRLTAAVALRECVDTVEFNADTFAPFLPTAVNELVRLAAEADTLESKRRVANTLNTVIQRVETRIVPLIGIVAQPLPELWLSAGEDWLFRASLLETVMKLIESAKDQSAPLISLVVPLVRDSFSPGAQLHLDEDALNLWQASLRNTTTLQSSPGEPDLVELFPLAVSVLAENLDLLGKVTHILESYFLLDAPRVLQMYANDLLSGFLKAMHQALPVNVKGMLVSLQLLFQVAPAHLWGAPLHTSGLFAHIAKVLMDDKATTMLLTEGVYVLARVAVADNGVFLNLMSATAVLQNIPESQIWEGILDQWWTRFDNMSEPRLRKLTAMGIANLVATGRPEVLERLATEICNLWLDVFGEIKEAREATTSDSAGSSLKLFWDEPPTSFFQDSEDTPEYDRRRAAYENDPVRTTLLTTFVASCLQQAEIACGGGAMLQSRYLAKVDPTVIKQIQAELARG
ncbi:ARM repeat-containing protein [Obba rivulosa]|uniref:ARM repeat-containing protein n=1 Tax=Obba rivulosa TaxID=1052685 RepID=A0A8E2DME8_9APHY|nr:ARM repeat-containing protein [Obba rivulosa]